MRPRLPPHLRQLELGMVALAILGGSRTLYFHLRHPAAAWRSPAERIDSPYLELRASLPPEPRLGYLSDYEPHLVFDDWMRLQTSYALAPRVLELEPTRLEWVVIRVRRTYGLEGLAALDHLRILRVFDRGHVALARRIPSEPETDSSEGHP